MSFEQDVKDLATSLAKPKIHVFSQVYEADGTKAERIDHGKFPLNPPSVTRRPVPPTSTGGRK